MNPRFSILVVCLNPGKKLQKTIDSVLCQTYTDYEIVVKDAGSSDGSVEALKENEKIRVLVEKDKGIYDAMNQAVREARGEYLLFLNCGDSFYEKEVLEKTAAFMDKAAEKGICYGDTFCEKTGHMEYAAKKITPFVCFRNIPCHQACFYHKSLFVKHPYEPEFKIRADYEHFLWCFFEEKIQPEYLGFAVAGYEGDGFSENKKNRARDKREHRIITKRYLSPRQLILYNAYLVITLVPLRRLMAESKVFSGIYQKIKAVFRR